MNVGSSWQSLEAVTRLGPGEATGAIGAGGAKSMIEAGTGTTGASVSGTTLSGTEATGAGADVSGATGASTGATGADVAGSDGARDGMVETTLGDND